MPRKMKNKAPAGDGAAPQEPPAKKTKLFDDSDDEEVADEKGAVLKVNDDYARRFEHNKSRSERQQLEEKYKGQDLDNLDDLTEDSEDDVSEDDMGELATEALDAEISATLNAIRSKDPRLYKSDVTFYQPIESGDEDEENAGGAPKEKAMTLKDYHTKNLLEGKFDINEDDDAPVRTHQQEMNAVKQDTLNAIKAAAGEEDDEDDDFMVAKAKPTTKRVKITEQDVENAEKDPETFLSNFMSSRAWVPSDGSHWKPLESDDEEEEEKAEVFESAYNLWFEAGSNEKLVTYARDAVAKTTVRRSEISSRHKARDAARAKREAEIKRREDEVARLRKLRVEEMEDKVKQIRKMGGFTGREFNVAEWSEMLEADWSDDKWDEEMRKRFGDDYHGEEGEELSDVMEDTRDSKKKPKKPKFDDDIDIKDLVPDFDDEELNISSDEDGDDDGADAMDVDADEGDEPRAKTSKQRKQERADAKSAARRDRRLIEKLVDTNLEFDAKLAANPKATGGFRYRETSPTTFGLTARDILLASDTALNEFAGLKKLATFRDPVKKRRDKKSLSKKARLRQWRMDTFGDEDGPKGGFEAFLGDEDAYANPGYAEPSRKAASGPGPTVEQARKPLAEGEADVREGARKTKKRSRKRKAPEA